MLQDVILKLKLSFLRLDGSTSSKERSAIVKNFNNLPLENCAIFLLSAKSGGLGLNLVGASRLILFDNDWNPSTDLQAMARIHRDGRNARFRDPSGNGWRAFQGRGRWGTRCL